MHDHAFPLVTPVPHYRPVVRDNHSCLHPYRPLDRGIHADLLACGKLEPRDTGATQGGMVRHRPRAHRNRNLSYVARAGFSHSPDPRVKHFAPLGGTMSHICNNPLPSRNPEVLGAGTVY